MPNSHSDYVLRTLMLQSLVILSSGTEFPRLRPKASPVPFRNGRPQPPPVPTAPTEPRTSRKLSSRAFPSSIADSQLQNRMGTQQNAEMPFPWAVGFETLWYPAQHFLSPPPELAGSHSCWISLATLCIVLKPVYEIRSRPTIDSQLLLMDSHLQP